VSPNKAVIVASVRLQILMRGKQLMLVKPYSHRPTACLSISLYDSVFAFALAIPTLLLSLC